MVQLGSEYVAKDGQKVILCHPYTDGAGESCGCEGCYFNTHRNLPCPTMSGDDNIKDVYTKDDDLLCQDPLFGGYIFKTEERVKEERERKYEDYGPDQDYYLPDLHF